MQVVTLLPQAILFLQFFLALCRIPGRPFDWLMG
jgi:hypothetical protein